MITSCAPMPFIRSNIPSPARSSVPSTCSAGYLFGTTRTSQPGEFDAPPFCRYDSTSGGVSASRPGQNGHCARSTGTTCSRRKSLGRFWRSVEMITQRPVTGSLRSSGIEGVLINGHDWPLAQVDGDDVEAARPVALASAREVLDGELDYAALLRVRDRLGAVAERRAVPCFHFHEDQRPTVPPD